MDPQLSAVGIILYVEPEKVNDAVAFYKAAFDAVEANDPYFAAQVIIGGTVYLIEYHEDPSDLTGSATTVGVADVAATVQKAVSAGAVEEELDEFAPTYAGQHIVKLRDPFGYVWYICEGKSLAKLQ